MTNETEQARFLDVLCGAVVTLWMVVSAGMIVVLFLYIPTGDVTLLEAIAGLFSVPFMVLLMGAIPAFVLGGLISYPFWVMCKYLFRLNRNIAGVFGGVTALIIALIPFYSDLDDRDLFDFGRTPDEIKANLIFILIIALLGAVSGWNGYRMAWNGRP